MKTNFKKALSVLITVCLVLSMFPFSVLAAETTVSSADALVSAINAAADGDTIILNSDITISETITIAKNITLKSNSNTITRASAYTGSMFVVTGALTLEAVTLDGNRGSDTALANLASELIRVNGGSLTLNSGAVLTDNRVNSVTSAGGVWVESGTFNMNDGAIIRDMHQHNNTGSNDIFGIAVNVNAGTFNMYGGTITKCDGKVGAVGTVGGTFNMYGGTITDNIANNNGNGGGGVHNAGTFNMYGGTISANLSWLRGGGVTNSGTFNFVDGKIINNKAERTDATDCNGAGIYTTGTFTMSGGEVSGNVALNSAGGIMIEGGTAVMSGGSVINNASTQYSGGGIFVGSGKFTMTGGLVTGNTAGQFGGGFAVTTSTANGFTISGGEVYGNTCSTKHCGTDIYITTGVGSAATTLGKGCVTHKLYLDNSGSRYSSSNAVAATSSTLTAGYGYVYVTNGASHSYSDWVITEAAACETTGLKEKTCSVCGDVVVETVPARGHNTLSEKVDATCGSDGLITLYCPVCGYVHTQTVIPATGHIASANWEVKVPATAAQAGEKVKYCKTCDVVVESATYTVDEPLVYIEASEPVSKDSETNEVTLTININNNPGIWATGFYVYYSSDLTITSVENGNVFDDEYYIEPAVNVDANENSDVLDLFKSCGAPTENTLYYCFYCEAPDLNNITTDGIISTVTFEYSSELEGTYEIGFVYDVDNIIDNNGNNCDLLFANYELEIAPISDCEHEAGAPVRTEPGCDTNGSIIVSCTKCSRQLSKEVLPATGHVSSNAWTVVTAPTASAAGEKAILCTVCSKAIETKEIPALGQTAIVLSDAIVTAGDKAEVTVSLQGNPGIWGLRVFVYYSDDITISSVANGSIFAESELFASDLNIVPADNYMASEVFAAAGVDPAGLYTYCMYFEGDSVVNATANGTLATLTFDIPADATGSYNVGLILTDLINIDADDVSAELYGGEIRIVESVCAHDAGQWIVVSEGNCTTDAVSELRCTLCSALLDKEITAAPGHKYVETVVDATCTENGSITNVCSACGDTKTEAIPAPGHNYETEVVEPDCTEGGFTSYVCKVCGDNYIANETDALGHDYAAEVVEPDCTEGGFTSYVCKVCGDNYIANETDALGHDYAAEVVEPDCTEGGFTSYVCKVCGDNYIANETDALGHDYAAEVVEPGCTEGGFTSYVCKACGDSYVADETEATGHNYVETVVDATCTEDGSITNVCSVCGDTVTEVIPASHSYDDACDMDCNVCGEYRDAPHNLTTHYEAVIPANCQETGHNEYWICEDCGSYFMSNGVGGYYETNPAWITYTGEHVRPEGVAACAVVACELCGEDSYGTEPCDRGDAPACMDATCVNCGGIVYGEGHSYGYDEDGNTLSPLCQPGDCIHCGEHFEYLYECENGSYAPCSVDGECVYGCGKQYPATGIHAVDDPCAGGLCWMCWEEIEGAHDYVATVTAPTCTEAGYTTYTCSACGDTYVADEVEATGHSYTDGVCGICGTECAHAEYVDGVCSECGKEEEVVTILLGDVNGDGKVNPRDTLLLKRFVAGDIDASQIVFVNADMYEDGKINSRDTLALKRLMAGK